MWILICMCKTVKVFLVVKILKDLYLDWLQTIPGLCLLRFINILSSQVCVFGSQRNTVDTFV